MNKRNRRYALLFSVASLGSIAAPGCGEKRLETGTQAEVTDQMKKEAEASGNYMENKAKNPGTSKK